MSLRFTWHSGWPRSFTTKPSETMNHRGANPEHFHRAVEHGLSLIEGGAALSMLGVMARGCAARGLVDAAAGFDHALLRCMAASLDCPDHKDYKPCL